MCPKAYGMGVEVCAVQVRHLELKCQRPLAIRADAMISMRHLRGVKRKLEDDHNEEALDFPYSLQCQSVFNISMCKLSRFRQAGDPSLLRSVLICNTLRNIEKEMEREGVRINYCLNATFLPPQSEPLDSPCFEMAHYESESRYGVLPASSIGATSENGNSLSGTCERERYFVDLDSFSGRLTPLSRTVYDRVDAGALWNDDSDRLTSLNWSSVLNFNLTGSSNSSYSSTPLAVHQLSNETLLHTLMPPTCGPVSGSPTVTISSGVSSSSSQSSSSGDEIFGDIDLSLYDFDLLSPLSPPNVKLAPVSAEELMRSLSGASENLTLSSSFCRSELLSDERDRVTPVMS